MVLSKKESYEQKTEKLAKPVTDELGFELVDTEYVKEAGSWYLRLYIDKEGGITVNDCEAVSRRVSDLLDEKDFIDESYIFEVSSPGLTRPLKKDRDLERNLGKEIEIRTYKALNGKKEFRGILSAYDKDSVTIEPEEGSGLTFLRKETALIRLYVEFDL